MVQDTETIMNSLQQVVNYNWEDELKDFQESFQIEIQSQDTLEKWIEWCEGAGNGGTYHIFYHLMVVKAAFPELFDGGGNQ